MTFKIVKKYTMNTRAECDAQGICGLMHPTRKGVAAAWFSSTFQPANDYVGEAEMKIGRPERQANALLFQGAPRLVDAALPIIERLNEVEFDQRRNPANIPIEIEQLRALRDALVLAGVLVED